MCTSVGAYGSPKQAIQPESTPHNGEPWKHFINIRNLNTLTLPAREAVSVPKHHQAISPVDAVSWLASKQAITLCPLPAD